jgi:hypothetical protein
MKIIGNDENVEITKINFFKPPISHYFYPIVSWVYGLNPKNFG